MAKKDPSKRRYWLHNATCQKSLIVIFTAMITSIIKHWLFSKTPSTFSSFNQIALFYLDGKNSIFLDNSLHDYRPGEELKYLQAIKIPSPCADLWKCCYHLRRLHWCQVGDVEEEWERAEVRCRPVTCCSCRVSESVVIVFVIQLRNVQRDSSGWVIGLGSSEVRDE
jgi:hypothetical protein